MKIMKIMLWLFTLALPLLLLAQPQNNYDKLTLQQKALMKKAFDYGKEFDLGYSMAAIMWHESFVGEDIVPFNIGDPSGGYWHKHIDYLLIQEGRHLNNLNRNLAMLELIQNMDYAAALAVTDLKMWQSQFGPNSWTKIYAGYNGGYSNSSASLEYAEAVRTKVTDLIRKKIFKPTEKEGEEKLATQ